MIGPRTLRYGDHDSQFVEVWDPPDRPRGSTLLVHGGYWRDRYALDLMDPIARHLADRGWQVLNIEYRRLGNHDGIWDEMSADVLAAAGLARPGPVVAIGHSAGGHLALWAASQPLALDAVVALAPVADLVEADRRDLSDGVVRRLLGGDSETLPARYRAASPTFLVPLGVPQLVIHGDADDDVPPDLSTSYASVARAAGDTIELVTPAGVDHFEVIDPSHEIWRTIDDRIDRWAETLDNR
ncbi:MAG: alpha/beta fold hydrolase [Acidimicrobiia bacterium]|nr:alpha/beta fold hydrolase [Acidimicrobiia bacterium]